MAETVMALPICGRQVSLSLERFQDHLGLVIVPSAVPRPNRQCFVSKKNQNVLSSIPLSFCMSHIVSIHTMFGPLGQGLNEERKMTRFKNEAVAFPQTQRITGINRTHVHCARAESTALSPFRYFFSTLVGGLVFCARRMRRKHCLSTAGVITTRKFVD